MLSYSDPNQGTSICQFKSERYLARFHWAIVKNVLKLEILELFASIAHKPVVWNSTGLSKFFDAHDHHEGYLGRWMLMLARGLVGKMLTNANKGTYFV